MIHAPDPMGKAAHKAAQFLARMDFRLQIAASPNFTREERADALRQFFTAWPKLCRAVAELEQAAPLAAQHGRNEDAKAQDFIEGSRA